MASAPKPKPTPRHDTEEEREQEIVLVVNDTEHLTLRASSLGPGDDQMSDAQMKIPITAVFRKFQDGTYGTHHIVGLIWMARVKAGQRSLSYAEVMNQFKTNADLSKVEIDVREIDPEA